MTQRAICEKPPYMLKVQEPNFDFYLLLKNLFFMQK